MMIVQLEWECSAFTVCCDRSDRTLWEFSQNHFFLVFKTKKKKKRLNWNRKRTEKDFSIEWLSSKQPAAVVTAPRRRWGPQMDAVQGAVVYNGKSSATKTLSDVRHVVTNIGKHTKRFRGTLAMMFVSLFLHWCMAPTRSSCVNLRYGIYVYPCVYSSLFIFSF